MAVYKVLEYYYKNIIVKTFVFSEKYDFHNVDCYSVRKVVHSLSSSSVNCSASKPCACKCANYYTTWYVLSVNVTDLNFSEQLASPIRPAGIVFSITNIVKSTAAWSSLKLNGIVQRDLGVNFAC